jgi:hypothetical protein
MVLERKNLVMFPWRGTKLRNDYAGEDQQQFIAMLYILGAVLDFEVFTQLKIHNEASSVDAM